MSEDEPAPPLPLGDGSNGANTNATPPIADADENVAARLAQLERAFGEQSARLRHLERRLGLVDNTSHARPFAQGETPVSHAPRPATDEQRRDAAARETSHASADQNREAAPASGPSPFAIPPRAAAGGSWQDSGNADAPQSADYARNATHAGGGATSASEPEAASSIRLPARRDLEQLIGGSLFNWLGIIAVTLTVGFFLKYAFDNQWIGARGRVLLGGAVGCGILAFAERLRARGYRSYAHVLSGGGILILYLSAYAAHVLYHLVGVLPAFALMIAVTTTAVLLAARYHAYAIAVLGLIGGFATPVLLSTGVDKQVGLFTYIALLNAGVLALAYFKRWRSLNHLAFIATIIMFAGWYLRWYDETKLWPTIFFLTLLFLMFNALGVIYNVVKLRPARWFDISLIITNATLYFASSYALLEPYHHPILGSFALLWSGFYVLLFYFTYLRHRADVLLSLSYVGAAVTFFTLAVAIQLDQHWVTIGWAMEGLMLTWIGFRADTDAPRYAALPVFAFAVTHWFTTDLPAFAYRANETFLPLLNRRAVAAAALVAAMAGVVWLYRRNAGETVGKIDRDEREIIGAVLMLAANVLALALLTADANDYFNARLASAARVDDYVTMMSLENARQFTLTVLWTLYALAALIVGTKRAVPVLRSGAFVLLALAGAKIVVFDAPFYNAAWHLPLFNLTFAAFAAFVGALWYAGRLYTHSDKISERERRDVLSALTIVANLYALIALSLEAVGYFEKTSRAIAFDSPAMRDLRLAQGLSLSVVWTLYGGAMLLYGHARGNRLLRLLALLLLTATTFKVFFLDLAALEKFYRIVSFLVLGAILLAVSFLYQQRLRAAKDEES